jgi:hypothetical protein
VTNPERKQANAQRPQSIPTPRVQPAAQQQQKAPTPQPKVHPAMLMRAPSATTPGATAPAARPSAARPPVTPIATGNPERLIAILEQSGALYIQLLAHAKIRRATLRAGDFGGFSRLDEPEKRVVAQIAELDRQRLAEARVIAAAVGLLVEIAEKLPAAIGGRVLILRDELRALILEVRSETSIVRQAAERLSAHIAGVVQSVHAVLAHANVYSSAGQIATGGGMISSLDIRS